MKRMLVVIFLGIYSLLALESNVELYRKFDKEIDGLHREILNLNREKDQILLSKDYSETPKRVQVEKIVDRVNNLRYEIIRLTKQMQDLNDSGNS